MILFLYLLMGVSVPSTAENQLTRGKQLYREGNREHGIPPCIACHGPKGMGNAQAGFPVIAGQHPIYTIRQLQAYKHGTRQNDLSAVMRTVCAHMSDQEISDLAYYLGSLAR